MTDTDTTTASDPVAAARQWVRDYPEVSYALLRYGFGQQADQQIRRDYPYALARRPENPTAGEGWNTQFAAAAERAAADVNIIEDSEQWGIY